MRVMVSGSTGRSSRRGFCAGPCIPVRPSPPTFFLSPSSACLSFAEMPGKAPLSQPGFPQVRTSWRLFSFFLYLSLRDSMELYEGHTPVARLD